MLFQYHESDFVVSTEPWDDSKPHCSKFDEEVQLRWDQAMEDGHFRYRLDNIERRVLEGEKHYVVELNEKRAKERRRPQPVKSVQEPFNPNVFNFNKIKPEEILFSIHKHESQSDVNACSLGKDDKVDGKVTEKGERSLVVINVSPLGYGHVLLVPNVEACLPQVLTESAIKLALEAMLLSAHRGFRIGFNSLCALASVNHLHFHAYYLDEELFIEYCKVATFSGICYELKTTPVRGFAVQLYGSNVSRVARVLHSVSSYFTRENIAHNMFISRGTRFGEGRGSKERTVRVIVWPRTSQCGDTTGGLFNAAAVELAGHLPIKESEGFQELVEADVEKSLSEISLSHEEFLTLKQNLKEII
ncbi:GDP-D-glucose phosphorylase 1-like isoform X2 [Liolophura sinensis]|uniref:GDP-D-glucose phosphorylase 1-like isoform X2 n=1 Tax=Liolophura sinensis TaxID=3198878 RepID=UPI0031588B8A